MTESDTYGEALSKVVTSSYRRRVLRALVDAPATPSTLAENVGIDISHVSRAISELREVGCVELAVPEETTRGRIYAATEQGADVLEEVGKVDGGFE